MSDEIDKWLGEAQRMYDIALAKYEATKAEIVTLNERRTTELATLNKIGASLDKPPVDHVVPQATTAVAAVPKEAKLNNPSRTRREARNVGRSPMAHDRETPGEKGMGKNGFAADEDVE